MNYLNYIVVSLLLGLGLTACNQEPQAEQTNLTATAPAGEASELIDQNKVKRLQQTLEKHFKTANYHHVKIKEVLAVENTPFYWVSLDDGASVFVTEDGQHLIQGDIFRLGDKRLVDISTQFKTKLNQHYLSQLKSQDMITYPATTERKHRIYVFSDVSCSYCQKLHKQIDEINAQGIEVNYIAWPRGERYFPAMERIWCSVDRKHAFDSEMAGKTVESPHCQSPVKSSFELGVKMGVTGTPAIFTENGEQIGGYLSVDDLVATLQK